MQFTTFEFVMLFLPAAVIAYFAFNRLAGDRAGVLWLVASSIFFYGAGGYSSLILLITSVIVNYALGRAIKAAGNRTPGSRALVTVGILFNLGLLGYFKYADFFIGNVNGLFGADIHALGLMLPLAISFFSIQQIAYLMDVYEGLAFERNFLDYGLFVLFFPKLLVGPIVHHKEIMPQFSEPEKRKPDIANIQKGMFMFSIGLFKKVVLSEAVGSFVNDGFRASADIGVFDGWVTALSYTLQIYYDFSGYTDMALGTALMMNIKLPTNFQSPYKARSLVGFWKGWHITLTNFATTYVYSPIVMSGGRVSFPKSLFAVAVVMLVIGFWHGAAWTFIAFGLCHSLGMVINHVWRKYRLGMPGLLGWFLTFTYINVVIVFFRAKDITQAFQVLGGMFGFRGPLGPVVHADLAYVLPVLAVTLAVVLFAKNSNQMVDDFRPGWKTLLLSSGAMSWSLLKFTKTTSFIYFGF